MKKLAFLLLFLAAAIAAAHTVRTGDLVQLSDGTVVRVLANTDIATSGGKSLGANVNVLLEDQAGHRVGMRTSSDSDGTITSTFWSPSGSESVEIKMMLGFGDDGLEIPYIVKINGKRIRGIVGRTDSAAFERFAKRTRAEGERLSEPFRAGLRSLWALGEAGYAGTGAGWVGIDLVSPANSLPREVTIVDKVAMQQPEQEGFQALFATK
jgi:hypothetical protein